jgi:hypothetical protein
MLCLFIDAFSVAILDQKVGTRDEHNKVNYHSYKQPYVIHLVPQVGWFCQGLCEGKTSHQ